MRACLGLLMSKFGGTGQHGSRVMTEMSHVATPFGTVNCTRILLMELLLILAAIKSTNGTPPARTCPLSTFPVNLTNKECFGLARVENASTAQDCQATCCTLGLSQCTAWNYCAGDGAACHADDGGCYVGIPTSCSPRGGWNGGLATNHCDASTFRTDISGRECHGLTKADNWKAISTEDACAAACCANGTQCVAYQFCANSAFCGSPSAGAGCWLGLSGVSSASCTAVQDGWDGRARWSSPPPAPPVPQNVPIRIDLAALGLVYDGIGGIVSNGECRLLYDYPEPERSDILDYLFLPQFGLSSQLLKVEIGSDAQSTVGTEPAYQHSRGKITYDRGIMFWIMREAKARNPNIKIAALEWSAPGWVGNGSFFSEDNIDYILGWVHGATHVNNVTVDYMGVWNEPPISSIPPPWLIRLRQALDDAGYSSTRIIAPDSSSTASVTTTLLADLVGSPDLRAAVDIIGTHGYWPLPPANFKALQAESGTRAWVSESWHGMGSWLGAQNMATRVLEAHIGGGYTGWTAWGLLFAAYPNVLCQDKGLMYSVTPWGSTPGYQVQPSIWTTAHFTQFTRVGWRFVLRGNGTDDSLWGASYATLVGENDFSIIFNGFEMTVDSINVTFTVGPAVSALGSFSSRRLQVWETNEVAHFVRSDDVMLSENGTFLINLRRGSLYSITTLANGTIVKGEHDHTELGSLFPLPYLDDFHSLDVGRSPKYLTDWDASFSVEGETDDGSDRPLAVGERKVLRQLVLQKPIKWHCNDVDPITIIGEGLQNYAIQALARIEGPVNTDGAYVAVYARVNRPYSSWCPAGSGYRLRLTSSSEWFVEVADSASETKGSWSVLSSGTVPHSAYFWTNISLACDATNVRAYINGTNVASLHDLTLDSGSAGLGSGYHYAAFDSLALVPLKATPDKILAGGGGKLALTSTFTNVQRTNDKTGWYGFSFKTSQEVTVTDVSRFSIAGNNGTHTIRLLHNITDPTTHVLNVSILAEATIDFAVGDKLRLDSAGFVHAQLSPSVKLNADQDYVLVSSEVGGGDKWYGAASVEPCAGAIGAGGTLPRMVMLSNSITVTGGVMAEGAELNGTWILKPDWEPRSYGPLSMAVDN